jgi:hypothetical protein
MAPSLPRSTLDAIPVTPRLLLLPCLLLMAFARAGAVEQFVEGSGTFDTTAPTSANIPDWGAGWGESGVSGWDYVGDINGSDSAVYLGNNWVITAAHVGTGTFILNGVSYAQVPGSAQGIVNATGTADLTLFQIVEAPALPPLIIEAMTPAALSGSETGDLVAMIGNGGGKSWGLNTVTAVNVPEMISGHSFITTDFETALGTTTTGSNSATNEATLVIGDSGCAGFIYNTTTGRWTLAGIGEKIDSNNDSYMMQLSAYASQINATVAVPEPDEWVLAGLALVLLITPRSFRRR